MNLEKVDILKFFKTRFRSRVSLSEKKITHPVREWMIGLSFTAITFLCSATYFGYHFYTHLTEDKTENAEEIFPVEYKHKEVESILEIYRGRKATFEELRRAQYVAPAPSPVIQEGETPLAEEQDEQYSSDTVTAPVAE